ncbi:TapY2 family type IVa secretion system protein [Psychromonas ossibalaenae]|uniref:TapY2 family type IVa secretion system protein n=1 Tax=Psychromonas ossibalaenae TaxID=444922 RepID=UPI00036573D3|nr:TapY2 family type IVa secretion system protein [Psychromonas ossibalaenae]
MNKILLSFSLWILLGSIFSVNAQEVLPRKHLKCYLQLEDKSKVIGQFVYQKETKRIFIENIKGSKFFLSDGVSFIKISKTIECVDLNDDFRNRKAMQLERITPF